jgi:hypothetical protein
MTAPRKDILDLGNDALYHCTTRCVRRAFLCGVDPYSQKNFDHRKEWALLRLSFLAEIFAIDVVSYALLSNHIHLVLRTCPGRARGWTPMEVAERWLRLCPGQHQLQGPNFSPAQEEIIKLAANAQRIEYLRFRLASLSWFMAKFSEPIARRANQEDGCKGHFWESRFKCRKLADEGSVLLAMAYVDLQLVRAKIADCPELSRFTSAFDRMEAHKAQARLEALEAIPVEIPLQALTAPSAPTSPSPVQTLPIPSTLAQTPLATTHLEGQASSFKMEEPLVKTAPLTFPIPPAETLSQALTSKQQEMVGIERERWKKASWLCPVDSRRAGQGGRPGVLPITEEEYFEFLDSTGRLVRQGKPGVIPGQLAPILERFGLDTKHWVETVTNYGSWFWRMVGRVEAMMEAARKANRRWFKGLEKAHYAFSP